MHPEIGYNFRMNDIQMAIGLTQMKKLPKIIELKQKNYNLYCNLLEECEDIELLKPREEVAPFIPFRVVLRVNEDDACGLMEFMKENGIETRTFFYPLHLQPCFERWADDPRHDRSNFEVTEDAYKRGVCLPSFAALTEEEITYVCDAIKTYYYNKRKNA